MPMPLFFLFFSGVSFFLLNANILFFDEEFLVGLCLLSLYAFIFLTTRRVLRFIFFHKVDFVYFSFYFLLKVLAFFYARVSALLHFFLLQGSLFYSLQLAFFFTFCLVRSLEQLREGLCLDFFSPAFLLNYYLTFTLFFLQLSRNISFIPGDDSEFLGSTDDFFGEEGEEGAEEEEFYAAATDNSILLPQDSTEEFTVPTITDDIAAAYAQLACVFTPKIF
jgi:hypothetical protein